MIVYCDDRREAWDEREDTARLLASKRSAQSSSPEARAPQNHRGKSDIELVTTSQQRRLSLHFGAMVYSTALYKGVLNTNAT